MAKITSISEVVDDIFSSISTARKKQRKMRSFAFWNKFGFERRTKERVKAVKDALNDRAIGINLEVGTFGSEKEDQPIILTVSQHKKVPRLTKNPKAKNKEMPLGKHKDIGEPAFEITHRYDKIEAKLEHLASVKHLDFQTTFIFSVLFVEVFKNDTPSYELAPGVFGATRSNWTYHTAAAISQTCRILNLTCKFEALGKRDAIIETTAKVPEIILAAEWEWDYNDIFGKGKELDKLKNTCKKNPAADAFLLIYCPSAKYLNHLEKIVGYWIAETSADKDAPNLFLHTIIFEEKGNSREFKNLKMVMIHTSGINKSGRILIYNKIY